MAGMIRMICDCPNLLFRVATAGNNANTFGSQEDRSGLLLHTAIQTLNKYYKQYRPDQLVFAFEGGGNWRKSYTSSPECVRKMPYKGNRVKDSSMDYIFALMDSFKTVMNEHTSIPCIATSGMESDDTIAGYVQMFTGLGDKIIIISGDKDFIQLLKHPDVTLINPDDGKPRGFDPKTKEPIDPEFFMFEKCIRGDKKDNVFSAYPRVRSTKIKAAFENDADRIQFMEETWSEVRLIDGEPQEITYKVKDLFEENKMLLDLECQPEEVRMKMFLDIDQTLHNPGKYNNFQFLKFLGKHQLNNIAEKIAQYIPMLSVNQTKGKSVSNDANPLLG